MNESQRRAFAALGIGPLWQRRTQPTVQDASADAGCCSLFVLADEDGRWLFVGEAQQAEPAFAAHEPAARPLDSMRLLERMLAAVGLRAGEVVHVPFVLPDASPDGGRATADPNGALAECIDSIAPRVVVALGDGAAQALLGCGTPAAGLRGRVHEARVGAHPTPVVVSGHPSQLLAAPQEKAAAWVDLCLARDVVDAAAAAGGR